jgi:2-isopropylmalate synthase
MDATAADGRVVVFDTTLRDGEQAPGMALSVTEKVEVAEQLARLGVDVVEAGFPGASDGDFEAVQAIASSVHGVTVAALCRSRARDVERAWQAISTAEHPRLHTYISTSPVHRESKLRMTPNEVLEETARSVTHARSLCPDVEFSAEDATRTELDFLVDVYTAAIERGATTINLPDTVGFAMPTEFAQTLSELRSRVPGADRVVWSVHCHNDLGLATANSLAALRAGARQVEVCVNGIGERAGNAALEEVVMALRTHHATLGLATGVEIREIARTSRLVSMLSGYAVPANKAVVGANTFAQMNPQDAALAGTRVALGKHSDRQVFADALDRLGVVLDGPSLDHAFRRFKELSDRKVSLADADLVALATEESQEDIAAAAGAAAWRFQWLALAGGTDTPPRATVRLERGRGLAAETVEADGSGDGMVDAACNAVAQAVGVAASLVSFQVAAVTPGTDAVGDVSVQVSVDGRLVNARGVSTDIVEASARAFLHAINKVVAGTVGPAHEHADTP